MALTGILVLVPVQSDGFDCGSVISPTGYHEAAENGDLPAMFAEDNCDSGRSLRTQAAFVFGVPSVLAFGMGMFLEAKQPD